MLNSLSMAQETVDQMLPRLDDLLEINGETSVIITEEKLVVGFLKTYLVGKRKGMVMLCCTVLF